MKKIYRNLTTYAMWATLLGLVIAAGPAVGFGQDTNEPAIQAIDEVADEPADEPADQPTEEVADEQAGEPTDEATSEPANELVSQPAGEAGNETESTPVEEVADRPVNRGGDGDRRGTEGTGTSGTTRAAYSIITERNMFSQNRTPARVRDETPRPVVRPREPNPESYYILRGVVRENDTFIAFLQDNREGGVLQLREGDKVARGTIKALTLDWLKYELEDNATDVAIGHNLEGEIDLEERLSQWTTTSYSAPAQRTRETTGRVTTGGRDTGGRDMGGRDMGGRGGDRFGGDRITNYRTTAPVTTPPPLSEDAAAELLQRLMERRRQQGGQ
jgi:hypothetical protein